METPDFSIEFFPPKTPEGADKLRAVRGQLAEYKPQYFSVTFGAGGTTQQGTLQTVLEIQAEGRAAAVVCSAGFVADHLETLYDLDIEARETAERAGIAFARTRMPNADPAKWVTTAQLAEVCAFLCSGDTGINGANIEVFGKS